MRLLYPLLLRLFLFDCSFASASRALVRPFCPLYPQHRARDKCSFLCEKRDCNVQPNGSMSRARRERKRERPSYISRCEGADQQLFSAHRSTRERGAFAQVSKAAYTDLFVLRVCFHCRNFLHLAARARTRPPLWDERLVDNVFHLFYHPRVISGAEWLSSTILLASLVCFAANNRTFRIFVVWLNVFLNYISNHSTFHKSTSSLHGEINFIWKIYGRECVCAWCIRWFFLRLFEPRKCLNGFYSIEFFVPFLFLSYNLGWQTLLKFTDNFHTIFSVRIHIQLPEFS